jgi:hypothetical protein
VKKLLAVIALLMCAALCGAGSRDSNYNNGCVLTGLCSGGGGSSSPFVYYSVTSSTNIPSVGSSYHGPVLPPVEVAANSTIVLGFTVTHGLTVTVSDTLGLTWSAATCTADAGTGNYKTEVWVASVGASPSASWDKITLSWGTTNVVPIQAVETVYANLATSSVTNGSKCTASITPTSGGLIDGGSFTPTTNNPSGGNVIWAYAANCAGTGSSTYPTAWSFASGFTGLNGEIAWVGNGSGASFPDASEWETQTSGNYGAVDPTFTATGETASGDCFNIAAVALKVNSSGGATSPTTIHVASVTHESIVNLAGTKVPTTLWPTTGNLRVITFGWGGRQPSGGPTTLSSVTSSDTCGGSSTFTLKDDGTGSSTIAYEQNCNPNASLVVSFHFTGGGTISQGSWKEYDVVNALSSSFQNDAAGEGSCPNGTNTNMPSITPSGASSGLAIAEIGYGTGPNNNGSSVTAPTGAIFDTFQYANGTDTDMSDNDDGSAHLYFSSTAAQSWSWTQNAGSGTCYWIAGIFD